MKPCPAEAAAALLDALAAAIDRRPVSQPERASVARALERVPNLHALRDYPVDRVLDMARAVEHDREPPAPEKLRAFAEELRAGAPAMRERGWGWLL